MQHDADKRGPGLKFPPPLLVVTAVGVAALADWYYPLAIVAEDSLWLSGAALMALATLLAVVALVHFFQAKTAVEPWHPTTKIIRHGVFRYSRNPIYLAFCIATTGIGLVLNSWWVIASLPLLVFALRHLVIRREEHYLEEKFGDDYRAYKDQVRRWF